MDNLSIDKIKVVIPRDGAPMGGVSSHIDALIESLANQFDFQYFAFPGTALKKKLEFFFKSGLNKSKARILNTKFRVDQLRNIIDRVAWHSQAKAIFHSHDVVSGLAFLRSKHASWLPLVHTVHGPLSKEIHMDSKDIALSQFILSIEREVYEKAHRLIAVDTGQAEILIQEFNIPREKIQILKNAVDPERIVSLALAYLQANPNETPFPPRTKNLLVPRRLVHKNGVKTALEASALLPDSFHLWIAGDGPLLTEYQDLSRSLGIKDRVHFLGSLGREQVLGLMQRCDAVIVPSVPANGVIEATSMAALEAMALSKPVVASNIGGLAEIVDHMSNGLLFEPHDAKMLAANIIKLDDNAFRSILCQRANHFVKNDWSVTRWSRGIQEIYKSVLNLPPI